MYPQSTQYSPISLSWALTLYTVAGTGSEKTLRSSVWESWDSAPSAWRGRRGLVLPLSAIRRHGWKSRAEWVPTNAGWPVMTILGELSTLAEKRGSIW